MNNINFFNTFIKPTDELGKISTRIETLLELNKKQKIVSSKINNICNYLNQIMKSENQTSFPKKVRLYACFNFIEFHIIDFYLI